MEEAEGGVDAAGGRAGGLVQDVACYRVSRRGHCRGVDAYVSIVLIFICYGGALESSFRRGREILGLQGGKSVD